MVIPMGRRKRQIKKAVDALGKILIGEPPYSIPRVDLSGQSEG